MQGLDSWLERDRGSGAPGRKGYVQQRGSGFYTLCESCNNQAGRIYVPEFRHWAGAGAAILFGPDGCAGRFAAETRTAYVTVAMQDRRPARFMKQVVTMLLAASPVSLGDRHPELRAYAHEPDETGLPRDLQLYLALFAGPNGRYVGGAGSLRNIGTDKPVEQHYVFEVAAPPFSYLLSIDEKTPAIETGNISNFADLGIHQTATVTMQVIVGYGSTPLPMDYRSPAALAAEVAATEAEMRTR